MVEKCIWCLTTVGFAGLNGRDAFHNGREAITKSRHLRRLRYAAKALDMREAHDRLPALANKPQAIVLPLCQEIMCFGGLCQETVE